MDDFKETNERLGHPAGDAVLAAVADRLRPVVRRADLACRVGGDEFAVILPEAGARDAEQLYRRIHFAVGSGSAGPAERVRVSAGIAELRPEDDSISLFQRAADALQGRSRPARARCGAPAGRASGLYAQRVSRRAASCSRRRTSAWTSSRNRAQSDCSSAERKCPGGEAWACSAVCGRS